VKNEVRCAVLSLVSRGYLTAAEIADKLNMHRTAVYRHLNMLERSGFVIHVNNKFYVAARLFLVFDTQLNKSPDGVQLGIQIYPDRGGFVDERLGFVLIRGPYCRCEVCSLRDECLRAVKDLARKLSVKIRSEDPLSAFREILQTMIEEEVAPIIRRSFMIVKYAEEEE